VAEFCADNVEVLVPINSLNIQKAYAWQSVLAGSLFVTLLIKWLVEVSP
jgi:hypothetical protein